MAPSRKRTPQGRANFPDVSDDISDYGSRIAVLEAHLKYFATREDVEKLKTWSYRAIVSVVAAVVSVSVAILALLNGHYRML